MKTPRSEKLGNQTFTSSICQMLSLPTMSLTIPAKKSSKEASVLYRDKGCWDIISPNDTFFHNFEAVNVENGLKCREGGKH